MKTITALFFLNLFILEIAYSATPNYSAVVCRLMHLQPQPDNRPPFYSGIEDKITRCDIPFEEFSRSITLTAVDNKILFYQKENQTDPPIAVAKIPQGLKKALLLFVPLKSAEKLAHFGVIVIDYSAKNLPEDGSIIFNSSPNKMRYLIGEQKGYAHAGQMTSVARPKKRNDFQMSRVSFQTQLKGDWKTSYESMLRFPDKKHRLFLAYHDQRTNQPGLRILRFAPQ